MENRNGLAIDGCVMQADGYGEHDAALAMIDAIKTESKITLGADKGYDAAEFVERLGKAKVVPQIAQNTKYRRSAVPDASPRLRATRSVRSYASGSRRSSAGPRKSAAWCRSSCAVRTRSIGDS